MANGPNGAGVPAWLQPALSAITTLGVPTVFAAILLWFVLTKLDSALRVIMANEETRTQQLVKIETGFVAALEEQTKAFDVTIAENIKAIDNQTAVFQAGLAATTAAIRDTAQLNRQTAERLVTTPERTPPP